MAETRSTKRGLRRTILERRDALDAGARAALSRTITQDLIALPSYRISGTVIAYMSIGSEFQTGGFVQHILAGRKTLVLPRVNREDGSLDLYQVEDPARDLHSGAWRIPEPDPKRCAPADPGSIEFVLVPGLAFDQRGGRLGYGAGFYDRLLAQAIPPGASLVAGAFEVQMVAEVPTDESDVPVDLILTEKRLYPPETAPEKHR